MTEFLNAIVPTAAELPSAKLAARLVQSLGLGIVVAVVYYLTQRKTRHESVPFVATLVLLCVLIAMVTQVIGENLARAFSLAGALAIIRFRTVVDDTRDTAFVIAAVVTGMAVGADAIGVAIAGIPVVAVAAWGLNVWGRIPEVAVADRDTRESGLLVVRGGIGLVPEKSLAAHFATHLDSQHLLSVATVRQGVALDLTYSAVLRTGASSVALVADLNRVEGIQAVEWKSN
jgi:hypothetical protein